MKLGIGCKVIQYEETSSEGLGEIRPFLRKAESETVFDLPDIKKIAGCLHGGENPFEILSLMQNRIYDEIIKPIIEQVQRDMIVLYKLTGKRRMS